jgi:hypothetical protein
MFYNEILFFVSIRVLLGGRRKKKKEKRKKKKENEKERFTHYHLL